MYMLICMLYVFVILNPVTLFFCKIIKSDWLASHNQGARGGGGVRNTIHATETSFIFGRSDPFGLWRLTLAVCETKLIVLFKSSAKEVVFEW